MEREGFRLENRGYRHLVAWQRAMDLVVELYEVSANWPREEIYGLTRQARRAAVSIASNLAEGHGRNSKREYRHFVGIAFGSLLELETQVIVAQRLGFGDVATLNALLERTSEVSRLLNGLRRSLETRPSDQAQVSENTG
jgi:four helix bundle protein